MFVDRRIKVVFDVGSNNNLILCFCTTKDFALNTCIGENDDRRRTVTSSIRTLFLPKEPS